MSKEPKPHSVVPFVSDKPGVLIFSCLIPVTFVSDEGRERKGYLFFFFLAYPTMTQVKEPRHIQWEVGKSSCLNLSQRVTRFRPQELRKIDRTEGE